MSMPALTLHRVDPAGNMHRYYRLDVQPDLFGEWCVIREWGRIGRLGRVRVEAYPAETQAMTKLMRVQSRKQGR